MQRKVTYKNLNSWYKELREFRPEIPCVVVANKIDGECIFFQPLRTVSDSHLTWLRRNIVHLWGPEEFSAISPSGLCFAQRADGSSTSN